MSDRIKKLERKIREANEAYYNAQSTLSDAEYDALKDELNDLDPGNKVLSQIGAAIQTSPLQKVKHEIPMGSQNKVNTKADFVKWARKTGAKTFIIQEKLDGISIELIYKKGKFVQAITRGDGTTGEDVTHNVIRMKNVKDVKNFSGSLRGEILLDKAAFDEHFAEDYANPRNTASGIARSKTTDSRVKHMRTLFFEAIPEDEDEAPNTEKGTMTLIKNLGLRHVTYHVVGVENACKWYDHYQEKLRKKLPHEIDGLIIKVNNLEKQRALGDSHGRPKGQIAWKFAAEMRETEVVNISWDVGKVGRVTPVAHLKPVKIGGVTVRKATLHNYSFIKELKVGEGARVLVSRRGDVIPYVEKVVDGSDRYDKAPTKCPRCTGDLHKEGEFIVCGNLQCPARKLGDLEKWIEVVEIDEVGPAFLKDMLRVGEVRDVADLYALTKDKLRNLQLPGYGRKKISKIVDKIQGKMEMPLAVFLTALNIPNVGLSTFEAIVEKGHDDLDFFLNVNPDYLTDIDGIGLTTADAICDGIEVKKTLIGKLRRFIKIEKPKTGKLTGTSFCFTGALEIKRSDAQKLVKDLGGAIKSSVSRGLTYLVQSDVHSVSGKSQKAKKCGTKVIDEDEFMDIVEFSFKKLKQLQ